MDAHTHNLQQLEALCERLVSAEPHTCVLLSCETDALREDLQDQLVAELPEFRHIVLDLRPTQVSSLPAVLTEKLPPRVLQSANPAELIHITHLGASALAEILDGADQVLLQDLEAESETLCGAYSPPLLFWADPYLWSRIEQEAPSLWQKMKGRFVFLDPTKNRQQEAAKQIPAAASAEALLELAQHFRNADEAYAEAHCYRNVLENHQGADLRPYYTAVYAGMGRLWFNIDRFDEAMAMAEKALEHRDTSFSADATGRALLLYGICALQRGDEEALEILDEAQELLATAGSHMELGRARMSMARLYVQAADTETALTYYESAAEDFAAAEAWDRRGDVLQRAAAMLERLGKLETALEFYLGAEEALRFDEDARGQAVCLQHAAMISQTLRKRDETESYLSQALEAAKEAQDEWLISALEDSLESFEEKRTQNKKAEEAGKKGFFGKLFG